MVLAILMVSVVVISPDDSEGVVLVKVIEAAKEIMPDDKKRGAAPAGAGRLLAFLGAGDARREGPPPGLVVLSVAARGQCDGLPVVACLAAAGGLPGMAGAGNSPAEIRLYLISH